MEPATAIQDWLFETIAHRLADALDTVTGERPAVHWERLAAPLAELASPGKQDLNWRQSFQFPAGAVWITAVAEAWDVVAKRTLTAGGRQESGEDAARSACLELMRQAVTAMAKDLSTRLGDEVILGPSEEVRVLTGSLSSALIRLQLADGTVKIAAGLDSSLISALASRLAGTKLPAYAPRRFDLLLDVEMPVSVSFGRAQMPLKDVLKLTTGSILELDRTISEPVDVIVNNCAIARGEVVVVEGNFGVRILQVISRQERMKSLT
jgi:flagellar motor switch protein FliN/FliY